MIPSRANRPQVQRAAAKAGIEPKLFCDKGAAIFKQLAQKALITNDHFVRTTDREHKDAVEYAWVWAWLSMAVRSRG